MTKAPSFDGFRSPEAPRRIRAKLIRELLDQARSNGDDFYSDVYLRDVQANEGPAGHAWDRLADLLTVALDDPVIRGNGVAVEFLEIMRSVADSTDARDTIDGVMWVFEPVFAKERAWVNAINSRPDPKYRDWTEFQWFVCWDQTKGKQAFARWAAGQLREKFGVKVSADTIARDWLPKTTDRQRTKK